ncbi:UDP-N-acetylglucosamine 4,6-dehydratase (inverting) [Paenibacillus sp. FSL R7-0198]|uniref:UDP-N-acetylglucosamine 4,6-dehydratase (inverting) n=1 Tax=unclassified Paenibacillus TaxID=185978 RepID=UPI0030D8215C
MLNDKVVLITGGTGTFGQYFTEYLLNNYKPKKIIIFSRDEYKQFLMKSKFKEYTDVLRFFIGDVRDSDRLMRAFDGVDYVVHAAAMKQVPACEYNPIEAIKTNINGATNVIDAALDRNVKKVVALSTDKAVNPINLYGGTKLVSDKLFISANAYTGGTKSSFSVVRYGNVAGSRGSVIPYFKELLSKGVSNLPITDFQMTRFWISLDQGVELVMNALANSRGGETYISKIPSFRITDLAKAMAPSLELQQVGIREGEKMHEVMITSEDSAFTYEYEDFFVIYPNMDWWIYDESNYIPGGKKVPAGFEYNSGTNKEWLTVDQLTDLVARME